MAIQFAAHSPIRLDCCPVVDFGHGLWRIMRLDFFRSGNGPCRAYRSIDFLPLRLDLQNRLFVSYFDSIKKLASNDFLHEKNDFAEGSKILLDTDRKIISLDHRNKFVGTLKIMSNAAKSFDSLAINLSI